MLKDADFIKQRIIETWDEKRKFFSLSALNSSFSRAIVGFSYKSLGFKSFKSFCLSLSDFFDIDVSENSFPKIFPKMVIESEEIQNWLELRDKEGLSISKAREEEPIIITDDMRELRKQLVQGMTIDKMGTILAETWDQKREIFNLSMLNDALRRHIAGFRYKDLGYESFREFTLLFEGFFDIEVQEAGMAVVLPKFDVDVERIQSKIQHKQSNTNPIKLDVGVKKSDVTVLPIPFDKAREAFIHCETDADGWVNTKDYYRSLANVIKGFNPLVYGGRFNHFYKNLDFLELKVVSKDLKMLRMIN